MHLHKTSQRCHLLCTHNWNFWSCSSLISNRMPVQQHPPIQAAGSASEGISAQTKFLRRNWSLVQENPCVCLKACPRIITLICSHTIEQSEPKFFEGEDAEYSQYNVFKSPLWQGNKAQQSRTQKKQLFLTTWMLPNTLTWFVSTTELSVTQWASVHVNQDALTLNHSFPSSQKQTYTHKAGTTERKSSSLN